MIVLIVRPAPSCFELVNSLNQAGIKAQPAPLLSFSEGRDLPTLSATLQALPKSSIVVAISPRAVVYAISYLRDLKISWRIDLHYVAIGKKTAITWQEESDVHAYQPPLEDSESILSMPLFSDPNSLSVLILRGNGGRALLGDTLQSNGAHIHYLEAYQRHWQSDNLSFLASQWRKQNIDTLVITSGGQLTFLCQTISECNQQWLRQCHILVPSKRIYNQAIDLGFHNIICVNSASNSTIFHILCKMNNSRHSYDRQE
ncbi:uroporphyrinogen-III synthase [Candidatus Enterovibrio altilux]|uniref:Uroporphyrinogen-III synthase n=1 Tax=Candidatus Enterovibrio altilux TaxID=1927128 RepID=A0A291B8A7_9GAMM|nr:uroporphyrinogen-III synthase [Candidatus Enterovibrio luxaltus]ATF09248.1 Uroporphyrinogen-III synthase [Candidatus Enterovibrio luxaltus]